MGTARPAGFLRREVDLFAAGAGIPTKYTTHRALPRALGERTRGAAARSDTDDALSSAEVLRPRTRKRFYLEVGHTRT